VGWRTKIGIGIALCLIVAWICYAGSFDRPYGDIPFNSGLWKFAPTSSDTRARMLDDLQKNYLPRGLFRARVFQQLGEPVNSYYDFDIYVVTDQPDTLFRKGGRILLYVNYDKANNVTSSSSVSVPREEEEKIP